MLSEKCTKSVQTHYRNLSPNSLRTLCRSFSANFRCPRACFTLLFGDLPKMPRTSFAQFSKTRGMFLPSALYTGKECLVFVFPTFVTAGLEMRERPRPKAPLFGRLPLVCFQPPFVQWHGWFRLEATDLVFGRLFSMSLLRT